MLNVVVIGSGGREHALALALRRDPAVGQVLVAPGNPGTWALAPGLDPDLASAAASLDILDPAQVVALSGRAGADLVVIGPEAPLVAGVADAVRAAGVACFGPSAAAAQLEGSKQFAKQVMAEAQVPTARSRFCRTLGQAAAALDEFGAPYVVKHDGLAAGKGVVVTTDRAAALAHAQACPAVVIEEFLDGPEVSLFAICDGTRAVPLLAAQDFKRAGAGDSGPNTGGMGAYAPLPWAPPQLVAAVMARVITPTLDAMRRRGTPFQGLLYAGLALTSTGLRVVEFNARFGDPETEAVLALLGSGLGQLLYAAATGDLGQAQAPTWRDGAALVVICAADGYPSRPLLGGAISLPDPGGEVQVLHCGTRVEQGQLVAAGGRVLAVVAQGADLAAARLGAYGYLAQLDCPTLWWRPDIAEAASRGLVPTPTTL